MKQTAVEWLITKLQTQEVTYRGFCNIAITHEKLINQAKEMEKEQIIKAYQQGVTDEHGDTITFTTEGEDYYNTL